MYVFILYRSMCIHLICQLADKSRLRVMLVSEEKKNPIGIINFSSIGLICSALVNVKIVISNVRSKVSRKLLLS